MIGCLKREKRFPLRETEILDYFAEIFWMFGITKIDFDDFEFRYVKTNYYPPVVSFLYLIVIAGILLIVGAISLKKRDISG